jgi:MFS family permease
MDRFDRAKALGITIAGLAFATALGGLASSVPTLVAARVLAGLFGGPAAALSLAIVADAVPEGRRGRALAAASVGGILSIVVGVPVLLEFAVWGGWRLPFFALAGLCAIVFAGIWWSPLSKLGIGIRHYSPGIRATVAEFAVIAARRTTIIALAGMTVDDHGRHHLRGLGARGPAERPDRLAADHVVDDRPVRHQHAPHVHLYARGRGADRHVWAVGGQQQRPLCHYQRADVRGLPAA